MLMEIKKILILACESNRGCDKCGAIFTWRHVMRHYRQITKLMATGQRLVALNNRLLQNQKPASNVFSQNIF